jgi:signal transduction histidine kinase/FixJ family two-component response regulator
MATNQRDRILVVERDPIISDLVGRQALQGSGYQVEIVYDASTAISKALQFLPDVIIVNLHLEGLSGKDLMVALSSQGIEIPIIIMAQKSSESEIIQAFRLGASDYLLWPVREAEVINVVERVLKQVHERRERERLSLQVQQTNQELQNRVRELTTIFSIGKAVTSITDQSLLFERILDGALKLTQADMGWLLLRDDASRPFLLVSFLNLPSSLNDRLNQPWDDGVSSLVAMSGEALAINGDPLKRFKIASLGQSALIVPIKIQKQVIGLLVAMRKKNIPFTPSDQNLLQAMGDYASISLVNARLFRTIEERALSQQSLAESAQVGEKIYSEILVNAKKELRTPLETARSALERLLRDPTARWTVDQRPLLASLQDQIQALSRISESIASPADVQALHTSSQSNLNELVIASNARYQHFAQQNSLTLSTQLPQQPVLALADPGQISQVIDGLLSNAVKYCTPGGQITIRLEKYPDQTAHLVVIDTGSGIDQRHLPRLFEPGYHPEKNITRRFGGLGIGLSLIKEIITRYKGRVWVESKPGMGSSFHLTLPLAKL